MTTITKNQQTLAVQKIAEKNKTVASSAKASTKRRRYGPELKKEIISLYPLCRETEDKIELAQRLGIESLQKLYNLASRLGVTREYDECYDNEGQWIYEDAYTPLGDFEALRTREHYDPDNFTERDDQYLKRNFGRQYIEEIRYVRDRTESAMLYRARHLNLRKPCQYWDMRKVSRWLGINRAELAHLGKQSNMKLYPCADNKRNVRITLVSTEDLAKFLTHKQLWKYLIEKRHADEWFIREILESYFAIREGNVEESPWISHGHTSLNPLSQDTFGTFLRGQDSKMLGGRYTPDDLAPGNIENLL